MDEPVGASLFVMAAVLVVVHAAFEDVKGFRIPNANSVVLAAGFVPYALVAGLPMEAWAWRLGLGLVVLTAGFALFALNVWGGGDAKLLAAAAPWVGLAEMPRFLMVMALGGGVLAVVLILLRRLRLPEKPGAGGEGKPPERAAAWAARLAAAGNVPYGVAIAAAVLDWAARQHAAPFLGLNGG